MLYISRQGSLIYFFLDEELDSLAYPDDFQDVEVKDEPLEFDPVSCDLFYHINYTAFKL